MKRPVKKEQVIIVITIIISFVLLYVGNRMTMQDVKFFNKDNDLIIGKAEVTELLEESSLEGYGSLFFECRIIEGENIGEVLVAVQTPIEENGVKIVEKGDVVYLGDASAYDFGSDYFLYEYERFNGIVWLGVAFALLLILFGRSKGFRTIISLTYTCTAIFFVFLPSIIAGFNIYMSSILVCIFITFMSLLIVQGPNMKALAAGLGSIGGLLIVSLITIAMSEVLKISGLIDNDSYFLLSLNAENPINLNAIVFAAITIGATGAILDIAVDIASALSEVHHHATKLSIRQIVKSGITIGQDIVGSMANTLILAYIGGSLSLILLLLVHSGSPEDLLNSELIIVEILQALAGSIGILFTIPLTAVSCGILYNKASQE